MQFYRRWDVCFPSGRQGGRIACLGRWQDGGWPLEEAHSEDQYSQCGQQAEGSGHLAILLCSLANIMRRCASVSDQGTVLLSGMSERRARTVPKGIRGTGNGQSKPGLVRAGRSQDTIEVTADVSMKAEGELRSQGIQSA